jgi:soluble lytic murein transglycosylase
MKKKSLAITIGVLIIVVILGIISYIYLPKMLSDILYPLEYQEYIIKYSKEYNLDPYLVSGVIFTESHFNKDSVSRVGARGLMQIMPATGATIAKRLDDSTYTTDKLFDPETNIRYGCWYLRYLMDNYNNEVNPTLAGYNGGGAVGDRYVVSREAGVPAETQGFIKKVNSARDVYAKLYPNDLSSIAITEPSPTPNENVIEKMRINAGSNSTLEKIFSYFRKVIYGE